MKKAITILAITLTILFFNQIIVVKNTIANKNVINSYENNEYNKLLAARGAHGGHSSGRGSFFRSYGRSDDEERKRKIEEEEEEEEEEERKRKMEEEEEEEYYPNRRNNRYYDDEDY